MSNDTTTNPEMGVEPVVPEVDIIPTPEVEDDATITPDATPSEPVDDAEEVDYEGNKYKVPKELKDALLRQSDYTKKTQEVANQRKAFEAEQAQFKHQQELHNSTLKEYAALLATDQQLEQYKQLDWDALIKSDPVEAMRLDRQMRTLQESRNIAAQKITQQQQDNALQQQQNYAKQMEEGRAAIQREIKDWSPELALKLRETGISAGFTPQELAQVADPRAVKLLHKAYLYDQIMQKAAQPKPEAPKVEVKPVTKVSGQTTTTKDPAKMSDKEFADWRKRQIAQRR